MHASVIYDTTPGGAGDFSPPADFVGDDEVYRSWVRTRWDESPIFQQWMQVLTRHVCGRNEHSIRDAVTGPYSNALNTACRNLDAWLQNQANRNT